MSKFWRNTLGLLAGAAIFFVGTSLFTYIRKGKCLELDGTYSGYSYCESAAGTRIEIELTITEYIVVLGTFTIVCCLILWATNKLTKRLEKI
ncbi:hypothetical protein DFR28_1036 [Arenicella xantha]|uniref:Uncharacterized protein n=1 Tax=Arenicella xantha TaxID=644221 RepID=A0A395JK28_9GAMM|nr:hypothetical protein DFR28_1036 [Arenicella xantha]